MERLQAAVAKAREARRRVRRDSRQPLVLTDPVPDTVIEAWRALTPVDLKPAWLKRRRVVTYLGERDGIPYDVLRTKIIHQAQSNGWRRIAVISPHGGCGKTTTVANLAFSFARQRDMRTLVMDLDLRRPGLATILGQPVSHTMGDLLERRIGFAEHGRRYGENLAFGLSAGPVRNSSELLQSLDSQAVLREIEDAYSPDLTLFDLSPLMVSDDNYAFLQQVDCAVIVVAAEQTPVDQIDVAERQVAELTSVMGIVLNKCRYTDGAYGYDYGYY